MMNTPQHQAMALQYGLSGQPQVTGQMDEFYNQRNKMATRAAEDQYAFDSQKSGIMNPQWQRYIQMMNEGNFDKNSKFNR
jgi:hypothetical protein